MNNPENSKSIRSVGSRPAIMIRMSLFFAFALSLMWVDIPQPWANVDPGFGSIFGPAISHGQRRNRNQGSQKQGKLYGADPDDTTPLVERQPFTEIVLNRQNASAILHVLPTLKNSRGEQLRPPYNLQQNGVCVFRFADDSNLQYEVPWRSIVQLRTFEEMVLQQAKAAMQQRDYHTAFKNYLFVYDRNKNNSELRAALKQYLFLDGKKLYGEGRYQEALTVFEELYDRDRNFVLPGVEGGIRGAIKDCYDKLIGQHAANNDLQSVRKLLTFIEREFGDQMADITTKWRGEIVNIGKAVLAEAQQAVAGDDPAKAHEKVRLMIYSVPEIKESGPLFAKMVEKFPVVYVGVSQRPLTFDSASIHHWADRRVGRLTHRNLLEFEKPGDEGGTYIFPSGKMMPVDESGLVYRFEINQIDGDNSKLGSPPISAYKVSERLLELGDINSAHRHLPWARIVDSVRIEGQRDIVVKLRYPHVRPQATLQIPYIDTENSADTPQNGFYKQTGQDGDQTAFELNDRYPRIGGRQHPKIIEKTFNSRSAAVAALRRGEIDIVDRIFPGDIKRLKNDPNIDFRPYTLPTVHCLIPNPRNEFVKSRHYRMGLLYGLNRKLILSQMITAGQDLAGFEIISGPFPVGSEDSDQTAYAYNFDVKPNIHDMHLGVTMISFAEKQMQDKVVRRAEKIFRSEFDKLKTADPKQALLKKIVEIVGKVGNDNKDALITELFPEFTKALPESEEDKIDELLNEFAEDLPMVKSPVITIAYPADDLPELAVEAMRQMWAIIGVEIKMRRLPPGYTIPPDDDYDFLYAEITMQEPFLDAAKVLGNQGLAKHVSTSINQEFQRLGRADRWNNVFQSLKLIHRYCYAEMAVIPLWQVFEHYAYRKNLKNTGSRINHLYQNVDRWQLTAPVSDD